MDPEVFLCHHCGKIFHRLSTLESHTRWKHSEKTTEYMCDQCGRTFQKKYNLLKHMEVGVHNMAETVRCAVDDCDFRSQNRRIMGNHYQRYHGLPLKETTVYFNTAEEFFTWKSEFEIKTRSRFVKMSSSRVRKNGCVKSTYFCHRDGNFVPKGKNIRHLKVKGSNKINAHCPAKVDVEIGEKITVASYIDIHLGHELDVTRLSLDRSEKALIARKLEMKVPFEEILDEINSSPQSSESDFKRLNLITRKDLWNIVETFKINPKSVVYSKNRVKRKRLMERQKKEQIKHNRVMVKVLNSESQSTADNEVVYDETEEEEGQVVSINDEKFVMRPVLIKGENNEYTQEYVLISDKNNVDEDSCLVFNSQGELVTIKRIGDHEVIYADGNDDELNETGLVNDETQSDKFSQNIVILKSENFDDESNLVMEDDEGEVTENIPLNGIVCIDGEVYQIDSESTEGEAISNQVLELSRNSPETVYIEEQSPTISQAVDQDTGDSNVEVVEFNVDDTEGMKVENNLHGNDSLEEISTDRMFVEENGEYEVTVADFDEEEVSEYVVTSVDEEMSQTKDTASDEQEPQTDSCEFLENKEC